LFYLFFFLTHFSSNGKFVGTFFSTATLGGGQETTALTCLPFFVHMGLNFVPIGYKFPLIFDLSAAHGGSPWGAGTIAGVDGSRQPSENELSVAHSQGLDFGNIIKKNGTASS
jgi:NAD(P)H dehydrogenase (quinone)